MTKKRTLQIGVTNDRRSKVFIYRVNFAGYYGLQDRKFATVLEACDAALAAIEGDEQVAAKIWVDGIRMFEQEEISDLRRLVQRSAA
ncbi:hypothetical protein [Rhodoligotrophos ferricapiens]|uniref:hypothetical protein n=1 Tax=Rhodoligotrophos ferricapiens TaxID=3069264 RepID=UPI00315DBF0F